MSARGRERLSRDAKPESGQLKTTKQPRNAVEREEEPKEHGQQQAQEHSQQPANDCRGDSQTNELKKVCVVCEIEDDGWPILSLDEPGWRRTMRTRATMWKGVENKIKFIAAKALRGVSSLIFDARGTRLVNELGSRYHVTAEFRQLRWHARRQR